MQYRTDWKQFLKYDENGRRSHEFPVYLVDTAPNEKQYLYEDEYMAMRAAEQAVKDARRAAREAELAAGRAEAEQQSGAGGQPTAVPSYFLASRLHAS